MSSTERSKARRDRAAWLLPNIALDATHATKLRAICAARGETASAAIRSLITAAKLPRGKK